MGVFVKKKKKNWDTVLRLCTHFFSFLFNYFLKSFVFLFSIVCQIGKYFLGLNISNIIFICGVCINIDNSILFSKKSLIFPSAKKLRTWWPLSTLSIFISSSNVSSILPKKFDFYCNFSFGICFQFLFPLDFKNFSHHPSEAL